MRELMFRLDPKRNVGIFHQIQKEIFWEEGDSRLRRLLGKWDKNTIFPANWAQRFNSQRNWKGS